MILLQVYKVSPTLEIVWFVDSIAVAVILLCNARGETAFTTRFCLKCSFSMLRIMVTFSFL